MKRCVCLFCLFTMLSASPTVLKIDHSIENNIRIEDDSMASAEMVVTRGGHYSDTISGANDGKNHSYEDHREEPLRAYAPHRHQHRAELTFPLGADEGLCFTEIYHQHHLNYTFEYAVLRGDSVQVWVTQDIIEKHIYVKPQGVKDTFTFLTWPGAYTFCFANAGYFGVTAKTIYMRLERTVVPSLSENSLQDEIGPFKMPETIADSIHTYLAQSRELQQDQRLTNVRGQNFAHDLNYRVSYLASLSTFGMCLVVLLQTIFLKKIFKTKSERTTIENYFLGTPT